MSSSRTRGAPRMTEVFRFIESNDTPGMMAKARSITPAKASADLRKAADAVSKIGSTSTGTASGLSGMATGQGGMGTNNQPKLKFIPATDEPNHHVGSLVATDDNGKTTQFDPGTNQLVNNPELSRTHGIMSTSNTPQH